MLKNNSSYFAQQPTVDVRRSKFDRDSRHLTTFNAADIVPLYVDADVLPGDTIDMDMTTLIRMQTPAKPVMDDCYFDLYAFFVPHRLVWDHFVNFFGENDGTGPWIPTSTYSVPQLASPSGGWDYGTLMDYMGVPPKKEVTVNALPVRAYTKIVNDWFIAQNLENPHYFYTGDSQLTGSDTGAPIYGGSKAQACMFHDYFTTANPTAQRGPAVTIFPNDVPVYTSSATHSESDTGLRFGGLSSVPSGSHVLSVNNTAGDHSVGTAGVDQAHAAANSPVPAKPINTWADVSGVTINELRNAFALQRYFELMARAGTRYTEVLRSVYGVTTQDFRLQRSEYLFGKRIPINIAQVAQTSETSTSSQLGDLGAYSLTVGNDCRFVYSAQEHGTLMVVGVVRVAQTYQQGLERQWTRRDRLDFYTPQFAFIGEQPIYNREIFLQGAGSTADDQVFGYNEAWADFRYKNSRVSGEMRSSNPQHLDMWHYALNFGSLPILSGSFVHATELDLDRTLLVDSTVANQFLCDVMFKSTWTRPVPLYSVPGLIDHL